MKAPDYIIFFVVLFYVGAAAGVIMTVDLLSTRSQVEHQETADTGL